MDICLFGIFGAVCAEFIEWHKLKNEPSIPKQMWTGRYWITTFIGIGISAVMTYLYANLEGVSINAIIAMHIGASTPLIISSMVGKKADIQHE